MRRALATLVALTACGGTTPEPDAPAGPVAPVETVTPEPPSRLHFHDATARLGKTDQGGRGASLMDIDQDGWPDVTMTSEQGVRILRGVGEGRFLPLQTLVVPEARAVTYVDVDADGDLDLYVSSSRARHAFFLNDGGVFTDHTDAAGFGGPMDFGGEGATFGDLDGDGDLDLFLAFGPKPFDQMPEGAVYGETGAPERLYVNDGAGHFTQKPDVVLAGRVGGETYQGAIYDADRDGDMDILSVHDFRPDQLFLNDGGNFVDASKTTLPGGGIMDMSIMGIDFADFDQDGVMDVYGTQRSGDVLFRGFDLRSPYVDVFSQTIVGYDATTQLTGWGLALSDFDNDGDVDLVRTANFGLGQGMNSGPGMIGYTIVLDHEVRGAVHTLTDVSDTAGGILATAVDGWGLAQGDIDRDGDLDVLVGVGGTGPQFDIEAVRHPQLLVNDGTGAREHGAVLVRLRAPGTSNPFAVGAAVDAYGLGIRAIRVVQAGGSYLSQHDDALHFGLGGYPALPGLIVTWPGGHRTAWLGLSAGEHRLERPAKDELNCCTEQACAAAPSVDACLQAEAYVLGVVEQCKTICDTWRGCCTTLTTELCNVLCGQSPPPPAVMACMASARCDGLLACTDGGRLLPGGASHPGSLCPL